MFLTHEASGALIMLLHRFDYNREGAVAEEYRQQLVELSGRRAAETGSEENGRTLVFAEDIFYAAYDLEREVVM